MSSQFFSAYLKSTFSFEHCDKKDELHSSCISEVIDFEKRCYVNVERVTFQSSITSQIHNLFIYLLTLF